MAHQSPEIVAYRSAFGGEVEAEGATADLVEQLIAAEQDRAFAKGACVVNCGFYTVGQVAIVEP